MYHNILISEQLIHKRWENGQKFTDDEAAKIMYALFNSVNHIHSVSIIHRDIKPGSFQFYHRKHFASKRIGPG